VKHKIWETIQKGLVGICLFAGTLAIVNMETIWQEYHRDEHTEINRFLIRRDQKIPSSFSSAQRTKEKEDGTFKPLQSGLSQSLEDDELLDENPFAHLSTLDPLQKLTQKGVAKFHRETFRSPDYREESGYDLLSYAVEHTDGSKSTIMAYTEKFDGKRAVYVVFLIGNADGSSYSYFRNGELLEQSDLTPGEANKLIAQRISQGIPFLSVSQ